MREGYQKTNLGVVYSIKEIPSSWNVQRMNDLTTQITDGAHFTPNYLNSGIPFIRVTDLKNKDLLSGAIKYISKHEHNELVKRCKPEKGDILYSKNGTIGITRIIDWNWEFSIFVSICLIKPKINSVNPIFLKHYLASDIVKEQIRIRSKQGAVTNLHLEEIRDFFVITPPLPEQQKIAEILSTVDAKIGIIDQQISETQELKKGLMQQLLTKGIGHTEFKDSALGKIPKSWEVEVIKSIGTIITGSTPKTSVKEYYCHRGILWASPADLGKGKYINITKKTLTKLGFNQTRKLPKLSIMVTCIGSTIGKIGMTTTDMSTNQQINSLVCDKNNSAEFYYYAIDRRKDYIKSLAGTQAVPLLNKTDFSAITFVHPPLKEQQKIATILTTTDDKLQVLSEKKATYQELKQGLMQQLLTGKVRV
jgi:type I restriction enzyme S subunit